MKTPLKLALAASILIFGISFYSYITGRYSIISLSSLKSVKERAPVSSLQVRSEEEVFSLVEIKNTEMKRLDNSHIKKSIGGSKLQSVKKEFCKNSLLELENAGDYLDSNSNFFKNPKKLISKLDVILGDIFVSNTKFLNFQKRNSAKLIGKADVFTKSETNSGCSGSSDIGVVLSSSLEAMKGPEWNDELKGKLRKLFIRLASSEVRFDSWEGLVKGSGIILPLLLERYPNSSELIELRSFRADILRESLNEKDLLRRSKSEEDILAIVSQASDKRSFYREQIERIIEGLLKE